MNWNQYFMSLAIVTALKSKDPDTQVGAIIISPDNSIVSTGYNGPPKGVNDDLLPKTRPGKYFHVVHAEVNAILYAKRDLKDHVMYCTLRPCHECYKLAVQTGIENIVYLKEPKGKQWEGDSERAMMELYRLSHTCMEEFEDYNDVIRNLIQFLRGAHYGLGG